MHPVNHIDDPYIGFNEFDLIQSIKTKMTCHDKKVASFLNWLREFNPRVCPVFIRGLKSNPI